MCVTTFYLPKYVVTGLFVLEALFDHSITWLMYMYYIAMFSMNRKLEEGTPAMMGVAMMSTFEAESVMNQYKIILIIIQIKVGYNWETDTDIQ